MAISSEIISFTLRNLHDAHKAEMTQIQRSPADISSISVPSSSIRHGSTFATIGSTIGRLLREAIEKEFSSTDDADANPLS